jgi:hypothetical protein
MAGEHSEGRRCDAAARPYAEPSESSSWETMIPKPP